MDAGIFELVLFGQFRLLSWWLLLRNIWLQLWKYVTSNQWRIQTGRITPPPPPFHIPFCIILKKEGSDDRAYATLELGPGCWWPRVSRSWCKMSTNNRSLKRFIWLVKFYLKRFPSINNKQKCLTSWAFAYCLLQASLDWRWQAVDGVSAVLRDHVAQGNHTIEWRKEQYLF